jgi:probable DNA metabolism protein
MTRFLFDGSFEGFLCAVSLALDAGGGKPHSEVTLTEIGQSTADLFSREHPVVTDISRARALRARITAAAGAQEVETLLLAQASNQPAVSTLLLRYIALMFTRGESVRDDVGCPEVQGVRRLADRVAREINKFFGFTRFRCVSERLYYAPINPDANIVGFLGPHFMDRFRDQAFLIHDMIRDIGFWCDCRDSDPIRHSRGIVDVSGMPAELRSLIRTDHDPLVPTLWREYSRRIAIPERKNPTLQAKNMPRRYWRYLVEKEVDVNGKKVKGK